jgi:Sap, sulfolipid-1-addressing protein
VSPEAIALALANAVRPTGIAAVYALLGSPEPRRMLTAYTLAGFLWSGAVGILVVSALHGVNVETGTGTVSALIYLIGGVACMGFAAGRVTGRLQASPRQHQPTEQQSRLGRALKHPTVAVAAGAGVATHLPGLFYLLGLNAIAAPAPDFTQGAIDVLIFNLIWFTAPIASLVLSVRRPEDARRALGGLNDWARRHETAIVTALFALLGAYFGAKGAYNLSS